MSIKVVHLEGKSIQRLAEETEDKRMRPVYRKLMEFLDSRLVGKVFDSLPHLQEVLEEWPAFIHRSGVSYPVDCRCLTIEDFDGVKGISFLDKRPGLSCAVALVESL